MVRIPKMARPRSWRNAIGGISQTSEYAAERAGRKAGVSYPRVNELINKKGLPLTLHFVWRNFWHGRTVLA